MSDQRRTDATGVLSPHNPAKLSVSTEGDASPMGGGSTPPAGAPRRNDAQPQGSCMVRGCPNAHESGWLFCASCLDDVRPDWRGRLEASREPDPMWDCPQCGAKNADCGHMAGDPDEIEIEALRATLREIERRSPAGSDAETLARAALLRGADQPPSPPPACIDCGQPQAPIFRCIECADKEQRACAEAAFDAVRVQLGQMHRREVRYDPDDVDYATRGWNAALSAVVLWIEQRSAAAKSGGGT